MFRLASGITLDDVKSFSVVVAAAAQQQLAMFGINIGLKNALDWWN